MKIIQFDPFNTDDVKDFQMKDDFMGALLISGALRDGKVKEGDQLRITPRYPGESDADWIRRIVGPTSV